MAKVAILVPYREMCELARPLAERASKHFTVMCLEFTRTELVESRVRELESQGCELVVARGAQAQIVKRSNLRMPLVEIRVTTQELGMVMLDLKRELGIACPRLGLVGFANMFCDTAQFNQLFGVDLRLYMVEDTAGLAPATEQAYQDGCNAVIGGDISCEHARHMGMACRFIPSGEESLRTALETAGRVCYAIDLEKHNSAEMDTMLNYTFNGIMQIDRNGVILRVNRAGYDLLERRPSDLLGQTLTAVLPNFNRKVLEDTLFQGKEAYAFLMDIKHKVAIVNLAPIRVDGEIDGAILTFQEGKRVIEMDGELRRELYQRGYIAKYTFDKTQACNKEVQATIALAKRIAKYNAPVLLAGEAGTGKDIMAQCLHNESLARNNAFVPLDCSAWLPDTLDTMLFGNYTTKKETPTSMAELAQDGTLYLSHVEDLPFEMQYKLLNLLQGKFLHNGSNRPVAANVRVIVSSCVNLAARVERNEFRSDLYYALSVLSLELLPLRRRREDILPWAEFYLDEWQEKYKRYVHLTQGARQFLLDYDWPGNLDQLSRVCERIVLLTEKRNIDEVFLRRQVEQITPKTLPGTEKVVLYKDQKAVEIAALLRRYSGNRERVAEELGVSKTTLWRYIKKYGIEPDYNY